MNNDDWKVVKPGDPYHGQVGRLIELHQQVNKLPRGTVQFPDGAVRTYEGNELRAVVRWRG